MKTFIGRLLAARFSASLRTVSGNRLSSIGIVFVVLLSIAVIVEDVQNAINERRHAVTVANVRLRNLAQAVAAHADSALGMADITVANLVLQLETEGAMPAHLLRFQKILRTQLAELPVLNNVVVIDEMGAILLSATASSTASRAQYRERDYFVFHQANSTRNARIGHPIRAYSNGHIVVPLSRRLNHADGSFAGVVAASIEVSYFDVFYRSLKGFEGGAIALLFDDHSVLAADQHTIAGLHPTDAVLDGVGLSATAAKNTSATSKISGAAWQYGHAHLKRYPLVAITSSPLETILVPWRESTKRAALSFLVRLVLLTLLGVILLFQIRSRQKAEAILEESAMQFRLVIDRIEDYGIYMLDTAGVITSWNAGAQRLTGLTAGEVIGRHCSALYAAEDVAAGRPERTLAEALRTGRNEDERWRLRKDGTRFLVNAITTPLYDAAGRHYGFLKVGRDVTASRQSEAMLEASEFRWKFALEGAGEGVWDWNEQTGAINFSRPYMTMLGYEENEIEGSFDGWKALVHPDDLKGVYMAFSAHHEGRAPNYQHEYRIRCKDGSYKWVAARGMVVSRDAQGRPLRTIGTQADISKSKAAEQRMSEQNTLMMQTNAQLQQANQVKSEFLANMSHELRTPLNAVLGFTGTLLMELPGPLNPAQKKQLEAVRISGRHLLELINEVLDLSKIESGVMDISYRDFSCQELITEVGHLLMPLATEKSLSLSLDLPADAIHAYSDMRLVKQILINLIGNAVKFTESGGVTVRLVQGAMSDASQVVIDVIDTGIGIDDADLSKLFQPFTQLESGLTRRFEGTGLGLSLSKKYADLLGAALLVRSIPGEGTTFSLHLPQAPAPI